MTDHLPAPGDTPPPDRRAPLPTPMGKSWSLVFTMLLGAILAGVALIVLGLYADRQSTGKENSEQTLGQLASQVTAACVSSPTEARKVFGDVCGQAQQIDQRPAGQKGDTGATGPQGPRGVQGPAGPRGVQGSPGPTGPRGVAGPIGPAGRTPPCVLRLGGCEGTDGTDGADGSDGSDGASGEPGPAGQDGVDGVDGADGQPGADGKPGPAGRGITAVTCETVDRVTFRFTYSDGTTATVTCGEPAPTPTR